MTTDAQLGSFDSILTPHSKEIQEIAYALRALIESVHAGSFETPRNGERCTTYGIGPKKMTEAYVHIMQLKASVNLGFYHGKSLPDPHGLLEGTGKSARHLKIRELKTTRSPAVKALLVASIKDRQVAAGTRE